MTIEVTPVIDIVDPEALVGSDLLLPDEPSPVVVIPAQNNYEPSTSDYPQVDSLKDLSPEQEFRLVARAKAGYLITDAIRRGIVKDDDGATEVVRSGRKAQESLSQATAGLIDYLAGRIHTQKLSKDDLRQAGYLGLTKSIREFDTSQAVRLVTYAQPKIEGEMKRERRDFEARDRFRLAHQGMLKDIETSLFQKLNREPTKAEMAAATGLTIEEVERVQAASVAISLETLAQVEGTMPELLRDESTDTAEAAMNLILIEKALAAVSGSVPNVLDDRQRHIIIRRILDDQPATQTELVEEIGVSQMHISRLERKALAQLREYLGL